MKKYLFFLLTLVVAFLHSYHAAVTMMTMETMISL